MFFCLNTVYIVHTPTSVTLMECDNLRAQLSHRGHAMLHVCPTVQYLEHRLLLLLTSA